VASLFLYISCRSAVITGHTESLQTVPRGVVNTGYASAGQKEPGDATSDFYRVKVRTLGCRPFQRFCKAKQLSA
jgi:hypothetical protein